MSMSQCIICSDLFDGVERVMAAPCGHVYHSRCLLRWLDEQKSCPECRQKVLRENVLDLYFNINSTQLADPVSLTNEIESLKTLLQESSMKASKLGDRNTQLTEIVKSDALTINTYRQANMKLEEKLRDSSYQLPHLIHCLNLSKMENEKLTRELSLLENIKTIVTGAQSDANEILNEAITSAPHGTDFLIAKRLSYCCSLTKQELKQAVDKNDKLQKEAIIINRNLGLTTSNLKFMTAKVKNLEKRVQHLESAEKRNISMNFSELCNTLNPEPSTSNYFPCPKQSKKSSEMIPITVGSGNRKKRKINILLDKEKEVSVGCKQSVSPVHFSPIATRKKETNSVSSGRYNSLGGHHSVVQAEDAPTVGRSKKLSLVPTKKKFRKL